MKRPRDRAPESVCPRVSGYEALQIGARDRREILLPELREDTPPVERPVDANRLAFYRTNPEAALACYGRKYFEEMSRQATLEAEVEDHHARDR